MTDRELLEKAAKAVGFQWNPTVQPEDGSLHGCFLDADYQEAWPWNPLLDDGDALWLVVKLGIDLMFGLQMQDGVACMTAMFPLADDWDAVSEPTNDNLQAATRRAIVRAAAEIGKGMP